MRVNEIKTLKRIFTFKFEITKDTKVAFLLGLTVVGFSFFLRLFLADTRFNEVAFFVIFDVLIKVILGFYIPLQYILIKRTQGLDIFGLTKNKWKSSLVLGLIFTGLLFMQFVTEAGDKGGDILLKPGVFIPALYIFVAGIFKMTFVYGFLRRIFDESFGIIPGIFLTSLFYSFHHAGFQPEFGKLIFVGILYASVYRITNNLLIIFPFFWGIGAIWDVLVNFGTTELEGTKTLLKATCTLILMIGIALHIKKKRQTSRNCNGE